MDNNIISTRGIRLKYKDDYIQAVILPDGRKLVITGSTYGMGAPLSPLSEIGVAKKSDLKWVLRDLVTYGYQEVSGSAHYDELRAIGQTMPWA
jgi:hypothetical protein